MKRLLFLAPLVFLAGCDQPAAEPAKPAAVDTAKVAADIRATDDQWRAAAKARDAAKVASFWSDDATLVMSGMPTVKGRENLNKFVEGAFKDKNFSIDWTVDKIEVAASGDMAYETVTETVTSTQGKKVITSHPIDTVIWKKQADGNWKAVLDQSTDVAAAASAAPAKK
jgi:uncharacterized protein (TIGR02246 family)